ncbi:MAG: InlB B-repeat-containing protein [Oscillospiraceae bacterium]|nr:InlB B-repeat-containing protein [Oscillospiraceae bacterium]
MKKSSKKFKINLSVIVSSFIIIALMMNIVPMNRVELSNPTVNAAEPADDNLDYLYISAASVEGEQWIELKNPTDETIYCRGLYLSNDNDYFKWKMPSLVVRPLGTVRINVENDAPDAFDIFKNIPKRTAFNFTLEYEETLYLTDSDEKILSTFLLEPPEDTRPPLNGILIRDFTVNESINDANYANWSVAYILEAEDVVYGDRTNTFVSIPEALKGAERIRGGIDFTRTITDTVAEFVAGEDITVFIGLDVRVENSPLGLFPAWLLEWNRTDMVIEATDQTSANNIKYTVFCRDFNKGELVTLGGNTTTGTTSGVIMYTVFATLQQEIVYTTPPVTTTTAEPTTTPIVTTTTAEPTTTPIVTTTTAETTTTPIVTTITDIPSYTISLNVNGGTAITPNTRTTGLDGRLTAANLPTPTRSGHTFEGWYNLTTGKLITTGTTGTVFAANTTIHARWAVNEQVLDSSFEITLNPNGGIVIPTSRRTDSQGCLMLPLPIPHREGYIFEGWFTSQTGGNRVYSGANGTKFNTNTTLWARWEAVTPVSMTNIPAAFKENFDWLRYVRHDVGAPGYEHGGKPAPNPELIYFNTNGTLRHRNSIFDQIWEGNGTINWAVRWESDRVITLAERRNMAIMLSESINVWTRPLKGMPGWPFGEIEVVLVGWAVSDASVIQARQPNETIWVNNDHRAPLGIEQPALMASAPQAMSRFQNFSNANSTYQYPGGLHQRYDMYQWVTKGFGGAVGGDWGNRTSDTRAISYGSGVPSLSGVQVHEVGHGFGLYDLYGEAARRPPDTSVADPSGNRRFGSGQLRTVMDGTYNGPLNNYDQWQIRYYWDWVYNQRNVLNRPFALPTQVLG